VAPYYDKRLCVRDIGNGDVVVQTHKGLMLGPLDTSQTVAFWQSAAGDSYDIALRSGTLYSVDLGTGKSYWSFSGDGQLSSAPIVINDVVAIGSLSGTVFVLDAATGAQLWSANVGAPILGGDGNSSPLSGLGAGEDTLIVPGTNRIAAYMMKH
jgi:outer membrane protein assembly factor BamB